jgi:hypothetical protein
LAGTEAVGWHRGSWLAQRQLAGSAAGCYGQFVVTGSYFFITSSTLKLK